MALTQQGPHFLDGLDDSHKDGPRDDAVADVVLDDFRNMRQTPDITIIQSVTRIDPDP